MGNAKSKKVRKVRRNTKWEIFCGADRAEISMKKTSK